MRWREARPKKPCVKLVKIVVPLPVRLGENLMCHQTFEAHGQKRLPDFMIRFIAIASKEQQQRNSLSWLQEG